jgi:hypothetical protein
MYADCFIRYNFLYFSYCTISVLSKPRQSEIITSTPHLTKGSQFQYAAYHRTSWGMFFRQLQATGERWRIKKVV